MVPPGAGLTVAVLEEVNELDGGPSRKLKTRVLSQVLLRPWVRWACFFLRREGL
jgi:hypothetical protein